MRMLVYLCVFVGFPGFLKAGEISCSNSKRYPKNAILMAQLFQKKKLMLFRCGEPTPDDCGMKPVSPESQTIDIICRTSQSL